MEFPALPSHDAFPETETELASRKSAFEDAQPNATSTTHQDELEAEAVSDAEAELGEETESGENASSGARPASESVLDPVKADTANFDALFAQWKATGDPALRERLILSQRNMVLYMARRFMDRGELFEDVTQVGMIGLINALDGFDNARGIRFSTFAIPSISGEIRRYFRDKVSGMRVPRRMQELHAQIQSRIEAMTQKLARSPTYAEIAAELEVEVEEIVETMELGYALGPQSLDDHVVGEEGATLSDTIGGLDPDLAAYEEHTSLQTALSRLTEKERRVLEMAYFEGFSQADIARQQGVSQMHISRLIRRALSELRHLLEDV